MDVTEEDKKAVRKLFDGRQTRWVVTGETQDLLMFRMAAEIKCRESQLTQALTYLDAQKEIGKTQTHNLNWLNGEYMKLEASLAAAQKELQSLLDKESAEDAWRRGFISGHARGYRLIEPTYMVVAPPYTAPAKPLENRKAP
jgi:hypothetical protein